MRKKFPISVAVAVLAIDLITKYIVAIYIEPYATVGVVPSFNLVHIYNRGITFGIFSSSSPYAPYVLSLLGTCIVIILVRWLVKSETVLRDVALASITGGAIGNIADRLHDGAVLDFLDFYVGAYHWPAFNLADVAIVCGVGALLIDSVFIKPAEQDSSPQSSKRGRFRLP